MKGGQFSLVKIEVKVFPNNALKVCVCAKCSMHFDE